MVRDGTVDGVGVGEVGGFGDGERGRGGRGGERGADEGGGGEVGFETGHDLVGRVGVDLLVVVSGSRTPSVAARETVGKRHSPREERASVLVVVIQQDTVDTSLDTLAISSGEDVQPG